MAFNRFRYAILLKNSLCIITHLIDSTERKKMKKALLIIDLQNDYFCGGKMELEGIEKALNKTNELISYSRTHEHEIIFIQHFSTRKGATFFIPDTKGVRLHENLDFSNDKIITKYYPNSFRDTSLQKYLDKRKIKELIICGAMTHMCIESTVRAGFDLGYKITLASDACATKSLTYNQQTINAKDVQLGCIAALNGIFCQAKLVKEINT